jgi:phosphoglucomutase
LNRIRFGTSGWRGIIADDFTFERSRLVAGAIARYLHRSGEGDRGVLVGYDTRFLGAEFARDAADLISSMGIDVFICESPAPTPVLSFQVLKKKLAGALNFTASHNPPAYQGIKFSPSWGGPALPETTGAIEDLIEEFAGKGLPASASKRGQIRILDPAPEYLDDLAEKVDMEILSRSGLEIVFDALYGTGAGYLDRLLEEAGCMVRAIHTNPDPLFGGSSPEPSEDRLKELSGIVSERSALGLSTDGDADRFGIVGNRGEFYNPNEVLSLLADYLLGSRGVSGDLARTVATTHLLDRIASAHDRRCHETPVGFKYIGQMISRDILAMGGEESAGMSIRGHVPEKDGILACLLVAEMVAASGNTLSCLRGMLEERYGPRVSVRVNLELTDEMAGRLKGILGDPPREVGGLEAAQILRTDGTKWMFGNGDWALLRLSGTEPVARLYVESESSESLLSIEAVFRDWITGGG